MPVCLNLLSNVNVSISVCQVIIMQAPLFECCVIYFDLKAAICRPATSLSLKVRRGINQANYSCDEI